MWCIARQVSDMPRRRSSAAQSPRALGDAILFATQCLSGVVERPIGLTKSPTRVRDCAIDVKRPMIGLRERAFDSRESLVDSNHRASGVKHSANGSEQRVCRVRELWSDLVECPSSSTRCATTQTNCAMRLSDSARGAPNSASDPVRGPTATLQRATAPRGSSIDVEYCDTRGTRCAT